MPVDKDALFGLTEELRPRTFEMMINETAYAVDAVKITYSETPVNKPTVRGGVYFSDKMGFKIKAQVSDKELSSVLSKTMLGPNTDFEKIQFLTVIQQNGMEKNLKIFANLTNYVQRGSALELNLMVVETELAS
ncbi:MAG: hypothetical protein ACT4NT_06430 [Nitrososphaerota archaeon]